MPLVEDDAEKAKKQGQVMDAAQGHRPQAGGRLAGDGRAARSGGDRLSALENDGGDPEIAAAGPRLAGLLRHQRNLYAFLLNHDKYATWQVAPTPQVLARQSATLLREFGNISPNYELTSKDLANVKWRQAAKELLDGLLKGSRADFATKFDELIIVPDGASLVRALRGLAGAGRRAIAAADVAIPHPLRADGGPGHGHVGLGPPPRQYGDRRRQARSQVGRRGGVNRGRRTCRNRCPVA